MIQDIEIYSYYFDVIIISDARLVEELDVPKKIVNNLLYIIFCFFATQKDNKSIVFTMLL